MNFLENIFKQLEDFPQTHFLQEMPEGSLALSPAVNCWK